MESLLNSWPLPSATAITCWARENAEAAKTAEVRKTFTAGDWFTASTAPSVPS
jgi:hypothetical protein